METARFHAVNRLVGVLVERGHDENAVMAARLDNRKLTAFEVNQLVRFFTNKGCLEEAKEAARFGNRDLASDEIERLVNVLIELGKVNDANAAAHLANRKLTTSEVDRLIDSLIKWKKTRGIIKALRLGASQDSINLAIDTLINDGWLADVVEAAILADRELTVDEIDRLVGTVK